MAGRSWYAPKGFWARTIIILAATVFAEYRWATTGIIYWGVLVGILHSQIGLSVQHDASHGALSANPNINAIFSYGADWVPVYVAPMLAVLYSFALVLLIV